MDQIERAKNKVVVRDALKNAIIEQMEKERPTYKALHPRLNEITEIADGLVALIEEKPFWRQ
ncbi:MAG: hypothetical protein QM235_12125 [Pseudomonadota bacterium]|jgi:hypothetical protein|nr:hypothetical protein [Pseudomonadota bacterium]